MSTRSVGTVPSSRTTWPFRNQEESVIWVLALVLLLLRVLWPNTGRHSRTTAARRAKTDRLILMDVSSPGPDYLTFERGMNSHCSAMRLGVAAGRGDVGWRPGAWGQEHRRQDRRRYCVRKWGRVEERRGIHPKDWATRFLSPLIKPDVPISSIRLSDRLHMKTHAGHPRATRYTPSRP